MRGQIPAQAVTPVAQGREAAGRLVHAWRTAAGLSERSLARRSAVARSTVTRLEHGQIKPRWSLLSALAVGIDPDRPKELLAQLVAAAGDDIAPESDGWRRYRRRRMERGILRGDVPLLITIAEGMRLHRAADEAWRAGTAVLNGPGALDDVAALDEALRLLDQSRALRERAGPPFALHIGKVRISVGFGLP